MNTTWIIILILTQIAWLWALVAHLKTEDLNPTDKICWTVVLCVLNVLGLLLFIVCGPKATDEYTSEEQLKQAINEGRR